MKASVGDRIIINGHKAGEPNRDCQVLEVRGADGGPPFVVQWSDSGHTTFFYPGSDATVQHFAHDGAGSR